MLEILFLMALGISIGYFIRGKQKILVWVEKSILLSIFILLFFLGLSIGSNELIMAGLPSLGLNALIITLSGISGSVLTAWLVWKLFFSVERLKK